MSSRRREREAAEAASLQAEEAVRATETDDDFVDADEDVEADEERY
jgi:hypothetical protein